MAKTLRGDITKEEIAQLYKNCQDSQLKERLLAIKLVYQGWKVTEVAEHLSVSHKTVYNWLDAWNEGGLEAIKPQKRGKVREAYLKREEWQNIVEEVKGKGLNLEGIREYIEKTRGIKYSYKGVWNVLRRNLKIPYGKPYVYLDKQPENAESELKKN